MKNIKEKYDLVISIGESCACSMSLRGARLQFASFPLDWVKGGKIVERARLIEADFSYFFNREDLEFVDDFDLKKGSKLYLNKLTNIYFPHEFYNDRPIEKFYDEVLEKYKRRTRRLNERVAQSKRVLFVYLSLPESEVLSDIELIETRNIIQQKYKDAKIDLLYIKNDEKINYKSAEIVKLNENISKTSFLYKMNNDNPESIETKKVRFVLNKNYDITNKFLTPKNIFMKNLNKIKMSIRKYAKPE